MSTSLRIKRNKEINKKLALGQAGLTLIEVLVAVALVSILMLSLNINDRPTRDDLAEFLEEITRAVRFSQNEAILRGAMVRIRFSLSKDPQEYVVEFGPQGDFVLPSMEKFNNDKGMTLEEVAQRDTLLKNIDRNFNKVPEFQENAKALPGVIRIIGMATNLRSELVHDGDVSVYFYPDGEKDSAFIAIGLDQEIGILSVSPYSQNHKVYYKKLEFTQGLPPEEMQIQHEENAKVLYEEWKRK